MFTTDLPDPTRYLTPGDLVLTGMIWCREPGDADRFVRSLVNAGAWALGAGEALGEVPPELIDACKRHGVSLLAVPAETSFAAITEEVARRLNGDRASAMTRVLGRRRLLLSAVAEGAGLDAMFRLMGREIGTESWLLTGLGRVLGGTGTALPGPLAWRLAAEYLKADRLPVSVRMTGPYVPADGDGKYSLFGVGGEPRITSWFLACAGYEQDWAPEPRESIAELAADAALERARLAAGRAGDRRLAEAIVAWLGSGTGEGGAPGEISSLMRAAGLPPDGSYLVAAMHAEADRIAGPNVDRWRTDLAEELVIPHAEGAVAAPHGDQAVVLIPLPAPAAAGTDPEAAPAAGPAGPRPFAARLRDRQPVLESDRARVRLTIGISAPAAGVAALAGALHEAESARRLAELRASGPRRPSCRWLPATRSPRTSSSWPACRAPCCARSVSACSARCWPTTSGTGPSCCPPCASSWPAQARGMPARPPCTCTSTRCGTGSGGSRSSPGATCPRSMTRWISSWRCAFASVAGWW